VRAIATDLDGTILVDHQHVSPRTLAALRAAEASGVLVVVATARPPRWVAPLVEVLGPLGVAVCANGALVYDVAEHRLVESHDFPAADVRELVRRLRADAPELGLGVEQGLESACDPDYEPLAGEPTTLPAWIEDVLHRPVAKVFATCRGTPRDDLIARVRALADGLAEVVTTDGTFFELMRPGVHKAATVERVIAEHGIPAGEVVAFGDGPNDAELLRWAGLGVAVANAHPDALAAADEVTARNDEDGVALVIERLLGGGQPSSRFQKNVVSQ
jgi:hydroxymethylpyrimidine pyrophosphatase-like HAD family hydrolase